MEERLAKACRYKFRACLRGAVRVVSSKGIGFAIAPWPLSVLVTLVCRDGDNGAHALRLPAGVKHIGRAHHIRRPSFEGFGVRITHQWLGCKMEHNLGLYFAKDL